MSYIPPKLTTLSDVVGGAPDAPCLTLCGGGPTLTRGALASAIAAATAGLRALGVGPGSVVSIVDVNTVREWGLWGREGGFVFPPTMVPRRRRPTLIFSSLPLGRLRRRLPRRHPRPRRCRPPQPRLQTGRVCFLPG